MLVLFKVVLWKVNDTLPPGSLFFVRGGQPSTGPVKTSSLRPMHWLLLGNVYHSLMTHGVNTDRGPWHACGVTYTPTVTVTVDLRRSYVSGGEGVVPSSQAKVHWSTGWESYDSLLAMCLALPAS